MNDFPFPSASAYGGHEFDTKCGPVALVRLGDLPGALARRCGISFTAAIERVCDGLRLADALGCSRLTCLYPDAALEEVQRLADFDEGLQLFVLRPGLAQKVRRHRPLVSEAWRPGQPVPYGFELRDGPRPGGWADFCGEHGSGQHIAWVLDWPEPCRSSSASWIDELGLQEAWEHAAEWHGAVDMPECDQPDWQEDGAATPLCRLAMRKSQALALWPELAGTDACTVVSLESGYAKRLRARSELDSALALCGPPEGFRRGVRGACWTSAAQLKLLEDYERLLPHAGNADDALKLLHEAWRYEVSKEKKGGQLSSKLTKARKLRASKGGRPHAGSATG
jgi:hypothetical protein